MGEAKDKFTQFAPGCGPNEFQSQIRLLSKFALGVGGLKVKPAAASRAGGALLLVETWLRTARGLKGTIPYFFENFLNIAFRIGSSACILI